MTETLTALYSEILVPVDFSSQGWRVLPLAEQLASQFDAPVRVLHVDTSSPWAEAEPSTLQLNARALGRTMTVQVMPDRDVALGVAHSIAGRNALVVMSTHARTGAADLFMDSRLEGIVRSVDAPLVVCGPRARELDAPPARIVLCVDADTPPVELLDDVRAWARTLRLPVDVLTVLPSGHEEQLEEMRAQEQRLTPVADDLAAEGIKTTVIVLRGSRPAQEIVEYAALVPGTVIALATHARNAAARALVGSVGMKVIRRAAGPVLLRGRDSR